MNAAEHTELLEALRAVKAIALAAVDADRDSVAIAAVKARAELVGLLAAMQREATP